ncbi:hypothetical protein V7S43_003955 [Phytophthora oleae]|uniref:RxLR effector protein n=1 Tax=Phytophthora oleae TaxID=2107226 RepID=A0ABD3FWK2_9STRA
MKLTVLSIISSDYGGILQLPPQATIRLFYLAGVAILAFVAGGDARVLVSNVSNQPQVHVASTSVVSTTRLLRTRSIVAEERAGGGISVSGTDKLAKLLKSSKVTDEQLQKWLSKGKAAESVFYRMNLANTRFTRLFESPQFIRWLQYADDLSASGKGPSAISVLSIQYGDDTLYKMIGWAKKESSTKALGTRLQADQLEHWVTTRKDPDEVFKFAWTKYVDDLNAKNEEAMVSIIPTLRKHFSDGDLFKIVLAAKRVDETEAMGTKLEDAFVQFWSHRKETPDNVLVELGLKKSTKTLLENPLLNMLTKYTEAYNVRYAAKKTTVIETLTRTFGDETVAKMLLAGKSESTTKKIATKFETEQLEMWMNSGQSVDDVYKLLNLPSRRDLLGDFDNERLFGTWLAYMNTLSIKNPDKTAAIFSTLAPSFRDRPMMQIFQAATKFSSMEKSTAKLHPLFKKWMGYVEVFNKKHPTKEDSWFVSLRDKYQGDDLDIIIDKAMKDPSTVKIAKLVEKERMKEWLEKSKYSSNMAFRFLHLNKASLAEKVFLSPKFELWVKYLDDWNQAYPSQKTTMIDGIRGNIHDLELVRMLAVAEKVPSTKKLASQLQDALVEKWIAEKRTLADLKSWLNHLASADDILARYTKKLNSA